MMIPKTLKQARDEGWRDKRSDDYGGEEIEIKGHTLIRNGKVAVSRSEWKRRGYVVSAGELPRQWRDGCYCRYPVYSDEQVEPRRVRSVEPTRQVDIIASVWAINRHAKRLRDRATSQYAWRRKDLARKTAERKKYLYHLKSQALHYLLAEGRLTVEGYHSFGEDQWAELLRGDGYSFHRPCPPREQGVDTVIDGIESRPRKSSEPRLRDALFTVESYLKDKEEVSAYEWSRRPRIRERHDTRWEDEDDDDYQAERYG